MKTDYFKKFSTNEELSQEIINSINSKNLDTIKDAHCGIVWNEDRKVMDKLLKEDFYNRIKNQNWELAKLDRDNSKPNLIVISKIFENNEEIKESFDISNNKRYNLTNTPTNYYCFSPVLYSGKTL
jgi:hypothetical protein